jgi:hypothetical protein
MALMALTTRLTEVFGVEHPIAQGALHNTARVASSLAASPACSPPRW